MTRSSFQQKVENLILGMFIFGREDGPFSYFVTFGVILYFSFSHYFNDMLIVLSDTKSVLAKQIS